VQKIPENFEDFDEALTTILENFDVQMEQLGITDNTFHNSLIDIMSKYPDSKELIQFIVAINDKLETKNELVKDVLSETLREIIITKQHSMKKISTEFSKNKKSNTSKIKEFFKQIPPKYIYGTILVAVGFLIFYVLPDQVIAFVDLLSTLK